MWALRSHRLCQGLLLIGFIGGKLSFAVFSFCLIILVAFACLFFLEFKSFFFLSAQPRFPSAPFSVFFIHSYVICVSFPSALPPCLTSSPFCLPFRSSPFAPVVSNIQAIVDRDTHVCKGYGFVLFEKDLSASIAVKELSDMGVQATFAKVSRAQLEFQGRAPPDPTNLYFTNLPWSMDEDQVRLGGGIQGVDGSGRKRKENHCGYT